MILILIMVLFPCLSLHGFAYELDDYIGCNNYVLKASSDMGSLVTDSPMGSAVADAVCRDTDADIAFLNGGDFYANLQPGEIYWKDILYSLTEDRSIVLIELTPSELYDLAEQGVAHIVLTEKEAVDINASAYGGFPQIGGFTIEYDASALPGNRIQQIILDNGCVLDRTDTETHLITAITEYMLEGGYDYTPWTGDYVLTDVTLGSALATSVESVNFDIYKESSRIVAAGAQHSTYWGFRNVAIALIIVAAVTSGTFLRVRRYSSSRLE